MDKGTNAFAILENRTVPLKRGLGFCKGETYGLSDRFREYFVSEIKSSSGIHGVFNLLLPSLCPINLGSAFGTDQRACQSRTPWELLRPATYVVPTPYLTRKKSTRCIQGRLQEGTTPTFEYINVHGKPWESQRAGSNHTGTIRQLLPTPTRPNYASGVIFIFNIKKFCEIEYRVIIQGELKWLERFQRFFQIELFGLQKHCKRYRKEQIRVFYSACAKTSLRTTRLQHYWMMWCALSRASFVRPNGPYILATMITRPHTPRLFSLGICER